MTSLWQHPYVNVFKHFNVSEWKKSTKEGEVVTVMDKTIKCTVYRITGSIPASNYIQLPKTSTQSLGLTGRYMYLLFKPIPSKYFVVHIDVATQDALVVRISFSNLFKEFKATSTWLQFPFVCTATKGSIHAQTAVGTKDRDKSGPAPMSSRWTMLCLDLQYVLSIYLNRRYSYIKSIKLCANMLVKNIFTSDSEYQPGLTLDEAKRTGLMLQGINPVPREMAFLLPRGRNWHDLYDIIRFPTDSSKEPFDLLPLKSSPPVTQNGPPGVISPKRSSPRQVEVRRPFSGTHGSAIDNLTRRDKPPSKKVHVSASLPEFGTDSTTSVIPEENGVHVYAHPKSRVSLHRDGAEQEEPIQAGTRPLGLLPKEPKYKSLKPDPILNLRRLVGFGGGTCRDALWTSNGITLVYPCHAVIVAMNAKNGHQRFFIGHTDKVSSLALNGNSTLLASGQTGQQSVVRVWRFQTGECLAMFKTHVHSLHCLSFSHSGGVLCGVGRDGHGKTMVVIWNTSRVNRGGEVAVMAKAHSDVDIVRMRIAAFDDTRMVSCGRDNVRLWRVKDGALRSAPVNLAEYHTMEFTDVTFEAGFEPQKDPVDRLVYACSRSGHIFEIDYQKMAIHHVRRLKPNDPRTSSRDKQTFSSGPGIAVNSMCVTESFCVTGSDDGYLRLWPLDFSHVYLEAEHEGPVTAVDITVDGLKILAGTSTGNLGILDVSTRGYTTVMRSHTDPVVSLAIDSMRKHMATVSNDHTIRVWDLDTLQQLYDFSAPQECPCAVSYHPSQQVFACGFENGCVRVFNVATTSMLAEHKQHRGKITGLAFSPSGEYLYSSCSLGSVALYDASENVYGLLRLLGNTIARGEKFGPDAIAVAPEGRRIAFIGPTEFTISVLDARTLDEVLRIDITSLNPADNTRTIIDTALRVHYAPTHTRHLLVATSSNSLLKFDARTGRLLSEMNNIHRSGCTSLDVIRDGRHLVTAGDRVIKVWDYHMRLDLNFQVFIGHTEKISKVVFTPDSLGVVSIGEAIFLWDFMANKREVETLEGRTPVKSYIPREDAEREEVQFKSPVRRSLNMSLTDMPRRSPPKPAKYDPKISEVSALHKTTNGDVGFDEPDEDQEEVLFGPQLQEKAGDTETTDTESVAEIVGHETLGHSPQVQPHQRYKSPAKHRATVSSRSLRKSAGVMAHPPPAVHKHFKPRPKTCQLAQRRYVAPPNQAGLQLMSVLGYNGNGRDNMIWQPDTGFFAYTCGCIIVVEDLSQSTQRHLIGHMEEISTLALQNDCQVLASASGGAGLTQSQICLWDLQQMVCHKVLSHHEQEVVCMAYSRDDRFLISVGDYRECSVVVWDTKTYAVLTTSHTSLPIHQLTFDPYTMNEFVTVGQNGSVLFWLLDETGADVVLNVHEAEVPEEVLQTHHMGSGQVDFTAACYGGDSTLYITTNNGKVTAWDTRHNSCFMHFEADGKEIGAVVCRSGRLVTGSVGHNLRLWSVVGIGELKLPGSHYTMRQEGLTMEDEMNLDGPISCAAFDDTLDMGIVGTETGTLWYINWTERTSIRLVTGHMTKVNGLAFANDDLFATCGDDGSLRMWSVHDREQTLQFQVMEQACTCLCFAPPRSDQSTRTTVSNLSTSAPVVSHSREPSKLLLPHVAAGYSDGTVRMFDLNKVELILKMHPHAVTVTAINFSSDGRMLLSGGSDGLIAVSSPTTGMTVRVISDHKGAPITNIDVTLKEDSNFGISAPSLWLATSADRRVSVWSADWTKDFCELVDWLTFPAPGFTPDGTVLKKGDENSYSLLPPSLARFSVDEPDIIVYTGYGMQKLVHFYRMAQRKVVRTAALTHWASSMDLSPTGSLVGLAVNERLVKLMDYFEGSFQDFVGHSDAVHLVRFSPNGSLLFSIAYGELIVWRVTL